MLPVRSDVGLPDLPEDGIDSAADAAAVPGLRIIEHADVVPGLDPSVYAYINTTTTRNIFRVRLP